MSKTCARCNKTVYPIEELKCLDKVWHKQCFKCQSCQMTLNMRNYKGFNKEPYCEAHIPKAKATTVAETPEYKRIAENTKIQSNVKYHADFEKAKGKFTQVADDPETLRIKENSKNISNVAYHGELEKKAVMEKQRNIGEKHDDGNYVAPPSAAQSVPSSRVLSSADKQHKSYARPTTANVIYTSDQGAVTSHPGRKIGSIHDLDPVNDYYGSLQSDARSRSDPRYHNEPQRYSSGYSDSTAIRDPYVASNGKVHGYSDSYGDKAPQSHHNAYYQQPANMYPHNSYQQPNSYQHPQQQYNQYQMQPTQQNASRATGRVYRALYEYKAQDVDEVSFVDGDIIINCTAIDEGWLKGQVQRTGQRGMLPANYVEPAI